MPMIPMTEAAIAETDDKLHNWGFADVQSVLDLSKVMHVGDRLVRTSQDGTKIVVIKTDDGITFENKDAE